MLELLDKYGIDALLVTKPVDLFYLTQIQLSFGKLLITHEGATLYVDGRYLEMCRQEASVSVASLQEFALPEGRVGFDAAASSYQSIAELERKDLIPLISPIAKMRMIKRSDEIEKIRRACDLNVRGQAFLLDQLEEGVTEKELVKRLYIFWLEEGAQEFSFTPHIAFGANSAHPHYHSSERALQKGDLVLMDIGVVVDHYHSDLTRVISFGSADPKMEEIYEIVFQAKEGATGETTLEMDRSARQFIKERGYGDFFPHSLGHGVGLEIHEYPYLRSKAEEAMALQEGMVVTVEPGIYLPGIGGVRLEDTLLLTSEGWENLTPAPLPPKLPVK